MRRTIYLPDELDERVREYLEKHPELSFSALVRQMLDRRVKRLDPAAFLELAGIVKTPSTPARERAEDQFVRRER